MNKCPNCDNLNKEQDNYCRSCGEMLQAKSSDAPLNVQTDNKTIKPKKKSSGLKIFLIVLFSIVGVAIIIFAGLFILGKYMDNIGVNVNDEETPVETIELEQEEFSNNQIRLISMFGYPDEFVIIFNDEGENERAETWIYEAM